VRFEENTRGAAALRGWRTSAIITPDVQIGSLRAPGVARSLFNCSWPRRAGVPPSSETKAELMILHGGDLYLYQEL
jgi:hypothetical protein